MVVFAGKRKTFYSYIYNMQLFQLRNSVSFSPEEVFVNKIFLLFLFDNKNFLGKFSLGGWSVVLLGIITECNMSICLKQLFLMYQKQLEGYYIKFSIT